jgi:hypothetical protein
LPDAGSQVKPHYSERSHDGGDLAFLFLNACGVGRRFNDRRCGRKLDFRSAAPILLSAKTRARTQPGGRIHHKRRPACRLGLPMLSASFRMTQMAQNDRSTFSQRTFAGLYSNDTDAPIAAVRNLWTGTALDLAHGHLF